MKTKLIILLGVCVAFLSCTKETETLMNGDKPVLSSQSVTDTVIDIVKADCDGLVDGFKEGSDFADNHNLGVASWIIGSGFAIVRAVGNSCEAAKEKKMQPKPDAASVSTMFQEAGNPSNPADSIGLAHYLMVDSLFKIQEMWYDVVDGFNASAFYPMAANILGIVYPKYSIINQNNCYSDLYSLFLSSYSSGVDDFTSLISEYIEDATLREVLLSYRSDFESAVDFSSFYAYSVMVEGDVIENNTYSYRDKFNALAYMATTRYGLWYWSNYYSVNVAY